MHYALSFFGLCMVTLLAAVIFAGVDRFLLLILIFLMPSFHIAVIATAQAGAAARHFSGKRR